MDIFSIVLIVIGLSFFEIIVSVDNAIVNAEVLSTMSKWARRWFLLWGFFAAVLVVRGIIPWAIVWVSNPTLGPYGALTATFSQDPIVISAIEASAPVLLAGGGTFLLLLFLHWFFLEPKNFDSDFERHVQKRGWFSGAVLIFLTVLLYFFYVADHRLAFGSVIGAAVFFITEGFKESAESAKDRLFSRTSDIAKIFYLEVLDATFSVDSVLGAFAFTLSVPLILVGNGLGVFIVRRLTIKNVDNVARYKYLKNGAMYSICVLSFIMLLDAYGFYIPNWLSPLITFIVVGWFFLRSKMEISPKYLYRKGKKSKL